MNRICTRCLGNGVTFSAAQGAALFAALGLAAGAALFAWPCVLLVPACAVYALTSPPACSRCRATAMIPAESPIAQKLLSGR